MGYFAIEEMRRRTEAFEMRCHRRMGKMSWTDRTTDEEVLEMVSEWKSIR